MLAKIILTTATFLILDGLWLGVIAKNFYRQSFSSFPRLFENMYYGAFAYVLLVLAIVLFVLPKAGENIGQAALYGAILGLVVYGVYDFTNLAVFGSYPLKVALVDVVWGIFVMGATSVIVVYIYNLLIK